MRSGGPEGPSGSGPRIAVVIPVYAGASYLEEMLLRLRRIREDQHVLPAHLLAEAIFVCDEPIDDSESILRELAKEFDWVRIVSLTRNSGQHMATAVGIVSSSADWILTLDEDLQHPPELVCDAMIEALSRGLDLVYIRSTTRIHQDSGYRDWSSRASKTLMKLVTSEDYSIVSSFRLIRGDVARAVAARVDRKSYLDAFLFYHTSPSRRTVFLGEFRDQRGREGSGYSLKTLIRHYAKLLLSVEISGLRLALSLATALVIVLLLFLFVFLLIALRTNVYQQAPGWMSLFSLGVLTNILLLILITYTIKTVSVLWQRSSGSPSYLLVDRSLDRVHLAVLQEFVSLKSTPATGMANRRGIAVTDQDRFGKTNLESSR